MQTEETNILALIDILKAKAASCQLILIPQGLEKIFFEELRTKDVTVLWSADRFVLLPLNVDMRWIQWRAWNLELMEFDSINHAIKQLKEKCSTWSNHSFIMHRRNSLIQEGLTAFNQNKRLKFPESRKYFSEKNILPFWTLLDKNLALVARETSSPVRLGVMEFEENKTEPPSRAYLKLWEILIKTSLFPQKDQLVLDLGSSPGGWSWVLAQLDLKVVSIDKAPLDPALSKLKNITYVKQSIFALDIKSYLQADWIFCDVICYPEKIYSVINQWLDAGYKGNMAFTIKFQGETDFNTIEKLNKIPNSKLIHLYHNKHELTWIRMQSPS